MTVYAPGTEETDPKKQNMSLQQNAAANTTNATNIATNTANIATNTTNIATNTASINAINAAWTAYTPTITAQTGTFTGATITSSARYKLIGKTCIVQGDILLTALGSGSPLNGLRMSLPFTAAAFNFAGTSREILATAGKSGSANVIASGTTLDARDSVGGTYIVAGYQVIVGVTYETT